MDEPFKEPNCCGSILFLTLNDETSSTLERHAVNVIGLVLASLAGCLIFGLDKHILNNAGSGSICNLLRMQTQ